MIKQAKFVYSPLGNVFEKKKSTADQGEKQIKALEEHWKRLAESTEHIIKDVNIDRGNLPFEKPKKKYLMNLLKI